MSSKERVTKALQRKELPDCVPLQFDLCKQLLEAFGNKLGVPVTWSKSWFEDITFRISGNEIRTALGSDCVIVGACAAEGFKDKGEKGGVRVNEFGMKMKQGPIYVDVIGGPFESIKTASEVEHFEWPDPHDPSRYVHAEEDIAKFKDSHFIIGDCEVTLFTLCEELVGMEKYLMDLALGVEYIEPLLEKALIWSTGIALELVERGVDAIWFGDDWGAQTSLLVSPQVFRKVFKEAYRRMFMAVKDKNPKCMIIMHSDGAVSALLDDFIDTGMEVFNPVQPNVPGHDGSELKTAFGQRLSFFGGIDQQYLLPFARIDEIEREVEKKIKELGRGGGYMIAPAHIIQADVSPERVETFISAVKKFGRYDDVEIL